MKRLICAVAAFCISGSSIAGPNEWSKTETTVALSVLIGMVLAKATTKEGRDTLLQPAPAMHTVCTEQPIVDSGWKVIGWRRVCEQRPIVQYN